VQAILDSQKAVAGQLTDFTRDTLAGNVTTSLQDRFNTADYGPAPVADDQARQRVEQALYDRIEPQFDRDEDRMISRLANQGIGLGSEAYSNAYDDFNRGKTDARLAVTNQGGQEYARDFGLATQSYQQQISDALLNRTQPINELSSALGGAPVINQPQAPAVTQYNVQPADFQGAQALQYQGQLNAFNQQQQNRRSFFGGLASLGGTLGAAAITKFSDIRLKKDITRIGKTDGGLPIYTFKYKSGGPMQMGVMAQDVLKVNPSAVGVIDGYLAVNYGELK
jgi:hypothetical protein